MSKLVTRERYSTEEKYKAVIIYKTVGNLQIVSKHTGIPYYTLRDWRNQDWWAEMEEDLRKEGTANLGTSITKIIDKALLEVQDRLENGDYIWDQKEGRMIRKPVGAHTANQILKDGLDRTFLMEKLRKDEKLAITQEKVTERLLKLAQEFERYTKAKEITNALDDERETGLREGESTVQVETRADSQTGSPQSGSSPLPESREGSQGRQS